ncbi:hypothetical protein TcasGA2_TC006765 [Tribolium castaneum]|uniref:BAG domain-containing protein n=1 Tax=Tribolium castaneum TaxID=7070 RepID=D6WUP8_TRICA|nr:PREDICTED: uncharacterized protein LOC103314131 isoform X2 [Tribolium castaneum]EFA09052.2 hypothetical protein TcasGA2_TC006765 [Tribolium castaneum]|eukprot:XP_008197416.1 PREDICTED: uncharacterized protein LOC103314131 isoform X2 [Tribolium castaneum]
MSKLLSFIWKAYDFENFKKKLKQLNRDIISTNDPSNQFMIYEEFKTIVLQIKQSSLSTREKSELDVDVLQLKDYFKSLGFVEVVENAPESFTSYRGDQRELYKKKALPLPHTYNPKDCGETYYKHLNSKNNERFSNTTEAHRHQVEHLEQQFRNVVSFTSRKEGTPHADQTKMRKDQDTQTCFSQHPYQQTSSYSFVKRGEVRKYGNKTFGGVSTSYERKNSPQNEEENDFMGLCNSQQAANPSNFSSPTLPKKYPNENEKNLNSIVASVEQIRELIRNGQVFPQDFNKLHALLADYSHRLSCISKKFQKEEVNSAQKIVSLATTELWQLREEKHCDMRFFTTPPPQGSSVRRRITNGINSETLKDIGIKLEARSDVPVIAETSSGQSLNKDGNVLANISEGKTKKTSYVCRGRGRGNAKDFPYRHKESEKKTDNIKELQKLQIRLSSDQTICPNYTPVSNYQNGSLDQTTTEDTVKNNSFEVADEAKEEPPLEILDIHQFFCDDYDINSLSQIESKAEKLETILKWAQTFQTKVSSFKESRDSIEYFVLDEKLMRLIEAIDKIKCQEEPEITARKIQVIAYINQLHNTLDCNATE